MTYFFLLKNSEPTIANAETTPVVVPVPQTPAVQKTPAVSSPTTTVNLNSLSSLIKGVSSLVGSIISLNNSYKTEIARLKIQINGLQAKPTNQGYVYYPGSALPTNGSNPSIGAIQTYVSSSGVFENGVTAQTGTFTGGVSGGSITTAGTLSVTGASTLGALTVGNAFYVDPITGRVGIGTSTPSDTFSLNGPMFFAPITPTLTASRLYNSGGDLYWSGNLIGGATTGNWTTDGTNAWRATGNVGVGTTSPFTKFSVSGLVTIADGTQGLNKVFTSDANGTGSWQGNLAWSSNTSRYVYYMGDSLTEDGTYIYQIQSQLGSPWSGFNKGIGGQTTTDMLARFSTDVISNPAASYAVILGGTNDVTQLVSATTIESNLQAMYTAAHNAGIKVVAVTITPRTTTAPELAIQQAVNTWIKTVATNVDYVVDPYVTLADPSNPTQLLPAYTTDGLHMTTSGYQILGNAIYAGVTWTAKVTNANLIVSGVSLINQDVTTAGNPLFNSINGLTIGKGGGNVNTNTVLGFQALLSNTLGKYNTANGWNSLEFNTTGNNNTAFGSQALSLNTTGAGNTASGVQSLYSNTTGYNNTANGAYSLTSNTTGFSNTANGMYALISNTTGYGNVAVGQQALFSNTVGISNTAIGLYALYANNGSNNTANGFQALNGNTTGSGNTASGGDSLYSNTTGYNNTASGGGSLQGNTTGFSNTANGMYALISNTTGYGNVAIGQQALGSNTTGSLNTVLGYEAGHYQSNGSILATTSNSVYIGSGSQGYSNLDNNSIVIGYNAIGLGRDTVVLGNSSITKTSLNGNVGIGTTSPYAKLSVVGPVVAESFNATSTTATSTFGKVAVTSIYDSGVLMTAPDYVFDDPNYKLLTVDEIQTYIDENKHLPWVTARGFGGMSLSVRINEVLESVENLWLKVFDLARWNKEQDTQIQELQKENSDMKEKINVLLERTNVVPSTNESGGAVDTTKHENSVLTGTTIESGTSTDTLTLEKTSGLQEGVSE